MSGSTIVTNSARENLANGIARKFPGVRVMVADPARVPVTSVPESMRLLCPKGIVKAEGARNVHEALKG